jgi:phosphoglycolate phosphatase
VVTIYFDLDGTLIDPKVGITRSIQYALRKLDLTVPHEDDLTWCIGPPALDSFKKLLGEDNLAHKALLLYRQRFSETGIYENTVYDGIVETLAALIDQDRRLFVATSKLQIFAERILKNFNLTPYFEGVFGAEMDGARSDKTELLKHALDIGGVDPAQAVMVGDRSYDVIGARNNGMLSIGVLYGYGTKKELVKAGAHYLCETPREVLGFRLVENEITPR